MNEDAIAGSGGDPAVGGERDGGDGAREVESVSEEGSGEGFGVGERGGEVRDHQEGGGSVGDPGVAGEVGDPVDGGSGGRTGRGGGDDVGSQEGEREEVDGIDGGDGGGVRLRHRRGRRPGIGCEVGGRRW